MRVQSYQYAPLGFRSPLYGEVKETPEADPFITAAWQKMIAPHGNNAGTWEFYRKVINRALDLFGFFPDWLEAQEGNSRLSPHMRAFVEDTLSFINTGKRRMAVISRAQCIFFEREGEKIPSYHGTRNVPKLKTMLNVRGEDYMFHWLNHPGGFNDMLATINVLFGDYTAIASSAD